MRVVVAGLGVQGQKRRRVAGRDFVAAVDPVNSEAEYRRIEDVPLDSYDAALVCIPDEPKVAILRLSARQRQARSGRKAAVGGTRCARLSGWRRWRGRTARSATPPTTIASSRTLCACATLIKSGRLGDIYRCRMFYGNGTARLVRDSEWRDQGAGVLPDLGSHLLDTARFWFGDIGEDFSVISSRCFENRAPDHVVFGSRGVTPRLEFEMTLLCWRNHFTCDVLAENGSAHISSLCKWGPSSFTFARVCCRAGVRRRRRSRWCRRIRPGRSNTSISSALCAEQRIERSGRRSLAQSHAPPSRRGGDQGGCA